MNIDILGIGELKWTRMGEFNSDDHYVYYCGQESLRRYGGIVSWSTKESEMPYLDAISKTTERSLFVSKENHSLSQLSKSMPQPVTLKKLKLKSSMKTYKTF